VPVIIMIVISSICLVGFLGMWMIVGGAPFFVSVFLALVTLLPMLAGVLALDRLEPEPKLTLIVAFLWGAGISIVLSVLFEGLGAAVVTPALGDAGTSVFTSVVLAPVFEELTKGLILFGLFWRRRHEINGITDGVIYAAVVALGFAAVENVQYYLISGLTSGGEGMAGTFLMRGIFTPFLHPVFTSMTGVALAIAATKRSGTIKVWLPIAGLIAAMLLHALWNGAATIGFIPMLIAFVILVGVLVGLLILIRRERIQTIAKIDACLRQYLPTGLVTQADLLMLSSVSNRKQARTWARSTHGQNGFNAMRDYQLACTELTMLHDRASNGTVDPQEFERRRQGLLALMRVARQAFLGPVQYSVAPMMTMPGFAATPAGQVPAGQAMGQPMPPQTGTGQMFATPGVAQAAPGQPIWGQAPTAPGQMPGQMSAQMPAQMPAQTWGQAPSQPTTTQPGNQPAAQQWPAAQPASAWPASTPAPAASTSDDQEIEGFKASS
jgi:RsiW-degrading membrane proteinase PrsW (M82 family)